MTAMMIGLLQRYILLGSLDWIICGRIDDKVTAKYRFHLNEFFVHTAMLLFNAWGLMYVYEKSKIADIDRPMSSYATHHTLNLLSCYTYELVVNNVLGRQITLSTNIHHVLSLVQIIMIIVCRYEHLAILCVGITSFSTPFLCLSKYYNTRGMTPYANAAFVTFAIVFFATRIIVWPIAFLRLTFIDMYAVLSVSTYVTVNVGLASLYVLQLVWMRQIVCLIFARIFKTMKQN